MESILLASMFNRGDSRLFVDMLEDIKLVMEPELKDFSVVSRNDVYFKIDKDKEYVYFGDSNCEYYFITKTITDYCDVCNCDHIDRILIYSHGEFKSYNDYFYWGVLTPFQCKVIRLFPKMVLENLIKKRTN